MKKPAIKTRKSVYCQNCDTRFKGHYCPNCGQQFKEFQKPFKFLIIDLAANVVSFDTRLWRSLKSLITKPGSYALEYINGHRMRYVPPLRLYVFISFLFFLLLSTFVNRNVIISEDVKSSINSNLKNGLKDNEISADIGGLNIEGDSDLFNVTELIKIIQSVINDPSRYMNSFHIPTWIVYEQFSDIRILDFVFTYAAVCFYFVVIFQKESTLLLLPSYFCSESTCVFIFVRLPCSWNRSFVSESILSTRKLHALVGSYLYAYRQETVVPQEVVYHFF